MNLIRISAASALLMATMAANAYDFSYTQDGNTLYFNILPGKAANEAEVTVGSNPAAEPEKLLNANTINIPERINHKGVIYTIVKIGDKAFSGQKNMVAVTLPSSIKVIGEYAFEGCEKLNSIKFPENEVEFGNAPFAGCFSISDIAFGKNWKNIDFSNFKWSKNLVELAIPAVAENLKNLKDLRYLTAIYVDADNKKYKSINDCLYICEHEGKEELNVVPRGISGDFIIADGTKFISKNAFDGCYNITKISIPESLQWISPDLLKPLESIKELEFKWKNPKANTLYTTSESQKQNLLIFTPGSDFTITVPHQSKNLYEQMIVWQNFDNQLPPNYISIVDRSRNYQADNNRLPSKKSLSEAKSDKKNQKQNSKN